MNERVAGTGRPFDLTDGRTIRLDLPPGGTGRSLFVVGLHKAGSTLFNRIMRAVGDRAGLAFYALPNELYRLGVPTRLLAPAVNALFVDEGYVYGGFRGIEAPLRLPSFAVGRTVMLVRDPRDMLTSLYFSEAFSHVPPGAVADDGLAARFAQRRRAALAEGVDEFVRRRAPGFLATYRSTLAKVDRVGGRTWRYEDVVFDKRPWIDAVLAHLGIAVDPAALAAIVARNDIRPADEDPGRHVRRVTPGDHREKLSRETIAALDERFAPILDRFGYA